MPNGIHVEVYPQILLERYKDPTLPKIVLLAVNLVKTSEGCFLEFQSSRGVEWIEFAAHVLGKPIEIWEGVSDERWGWYKQPANPYSLRLYDPSGKPAVRPHYDIPTTFLNFATPRQKTAYLILWIKNVGFCLCQNCNQHKFRN